MVHGAAITAIGLMSGTSCDGVDAAIVKTDGHSIEALGPTTSYSFPEELRQRLKDATVSGEASVELEEALTRVHADVVEQLLAANGIASSQIALIGFHGHTIAHDPAQGVTRQIGLPQQLAQWTGIDVIGDFRSHDVQCGGEGAPLVPVFHQALFHAHPKPLVVLNIGGVANVTYVGKEQALAFDTGPGNALMDDWMHQHHASRYDLEGKHARALAMDEAVVAEFLSDPYFNRRPPKSLDRNHFMALLSSSLDNPQGLATLLECTVQSIVQSQQYFPEVPVAWLVTGGGRHNQYLMERLSASLEASVTPIEAAGFDGDMIEAQAFAYLAVRSHYGLPLTFPETTGVTEATLGGVFYPASPV